MGIQINGQTDTISATDGSFTISGASGNLTGNLTGDVTGNLTGDVTGNLTGTASTATAAATAYGLSGSPTLSGITSVSTTNLTVNGSAYPSAGPLSNRNLIYNGAMQVWQRGTSTASVTGNEYYSADRFRNVTISAGTWTLSKSTEVPTGQGFAASLKYDCTTANAALGTGNILSLEQRFEGQDMQSLKKGTANAESLTLSFWVRSNKTGTYIAELRDDDNNRTIAKSYTINASNTWEKKVLTFPGDTTGALDNDNALSFYVNLWLAAGTDYSSGTLATSWGTRVNANRAVGQVNLADSTSNEWYITGVQLEVGSVATPFEHRSYGDDLARCIRYFRKHQSIIASAGGYTDLIMTTVTFDPPMRTGPSVDVTGAIQVTAPGIANYNQSSAGITQSNYTTAHGIFFYLPNYSGLTNHRTYIWNDSSDTITFSAEL